MSKTSAKKSSQSSKQAQKKLTQLVRGLNSGKTKVAASSSLLGSCARKIYCV